MRTHIRFLGAVLLAGFVLGGCSRDPNVRKQKYFDSGTRYFHAGKYREAAIELENAIQLDPNFAAAHYQLAQCYIREAFWNGAYQQLLRTVDLQPQNADALTDLAKLLFAGQQFQNARDRAQAALTVNPDDFDAQLVAANSDAALGNLTLGLQETQKAIDMAPKRAEGYTALGLLQLKNHKIDDAEVSFQKAVAADPAFVPARLLLGQAYQSQKRWSDAERLYNTAIAAVPGNPAPRAALAALYLAQGRKADAERALEDAKKDMTNDSSGYRMLGDFYIATGDTEKASAEFASLVQAHPKDSSVKRTYVQLLIFQNRMAEAQTLNDQVLKDNPKDVDATIVRAQILSREGNTNDAISALQGVVKNAPDNAVGHYYLGVIYNQTGASELAESEWRTAARLTPSLVDAQRALASLGVNRGNWDMVAQSAGQLIQTEPGAAEGYLYRGTERAARGDQAAAEMNFNKAITLAPGSAAGYTTMGKLRVIQKRLGDAEKLFKEALARDPNSKEALAALTQLAVEEKQPEQALKAVQMQIAKSPNNSQFYLLLGELDLNVKDKTQAETALQKAVDLDPANIDAFLLLAQLQTQRGGTQEAIGSYQKAIKTNPRDLRPYMGQGSLEENAGNWQEAEKLYGQALQVKPGNPVAANNLAYLLIEHGGDKDVAVSMAQTARRGLPDVSNTADTLGWAYYYKGAYSAAVEQMRLAVKDSPKNSMYHYHLGLAYEKLEDKAHAREELNRALQLQPTPSEENEIRKLLAYSSPQ